MHQRPLQLAIDHLAATIEAEDHLEEIALWAVAVLSDRPGMTVAVSPSDKHVEAVYDIGEDWVDQVTELLDEQPEKQRETLRVVWAVVQRLVDEVRIRGLTHGRQVQPMVTPAIPPQPA